jgi:hypothetical protein
LVKLHLELPRRFLFINNDLGKLLVHKVHDVVYGRRTGSYTLRSRVIASAGDRNSVYYAFNGGSKTTLSYPDNLTSWTWVNGPIVSLTAGTHTLTIWNRERGTKLDAFELVAKN